jgi:hypothetical protein
VNTSNGSQNRSTIRLLNHRGSILFPMVVAISIAAMSIFYYYSNAYLMRKLEDQKLSNVSNLSAYVQSVRALLNSQSALMKSVQLAGNGSLASCLNDPEFDCIGVATEQNFVLASEDGSIFNDPTSASNGVDPGGLACNSFPSITCPFRYELKWSRECVGLGPCRSPDLFIRGQLVIANLSSLKFNINPSNYAFQVKLR